MFADDDIVGEEAEDDEDDNQDDDDEANASLQSLCPPEQHDECLPGAEKEFNELQKTKEELKAAVLSKKQLMKELMRSEKERVIFFRYLITQFKHFCNFHLQYLPFNIKPFILTI